jgi:hypothetical protein
MLISDVFMLSKCDKNYTLIIKLAYQISTVYSDRISISRRLKGGRLLRSYLQAHNSFL